MVATIPTFAVKGRSAPAGRSLPAALPMRRMGPHRGPGTTLALPSRRPSPQDKGSLRFSPDGLGQEAERAFRYGQPWCNSLYHAFRDLQRYRRPQALDQRQRLCEEWHAEHSDRAASALNALTDSVSGPRGCHTVTIPRKTCAAHGSISASPCLLITPEMYAGPRERP
jgi:hypothetical protein